MAPDEVRRASPRDDDDHDDDAPRQYSRRGDDPDVSQNDGDIEAGGGPEDNKSSFFRNRWFIGLAIAILLGVIGAAVVWWLNARHYETTDDAFVDTHIVHISPQVSGLVTKVDVDDNQLVRQGQPLVEIDSADATAKVEQVEAQEAQAVTQYFQSIATKKGADAQAENAERDLARYRLLQRTLPQAVAQQQIDQAEAAARSTAAQLEAARGAVASAEAQINVYKAQLAAAKLTLGYTHIVAPTDGHVAQRSVAIGNYVSPGQELMAIVPLDIWVTANFKETQLALMRIGQPVTIELDACGEREIHGHIDSLQRGAGQAFGLLPPENATGNYVKVVQRVPVKIALDGVPSGCTLGPGMSVEPRVKVR